MPETPTPLTHTVRSNTTPPAFWTQDTLSHVLVSGEDTGGAMTVLEQLMPKGIGPPPHVHERLLECFFVLEGEIKYQVGDAIVIGKQGDAVAIPPWTTHAFKVRSEVARVLDMYTPGGFDEWIAMLGVPAQPQTLPPEGAVRDPAPEQEAFARRVEQLATQRWAPEEPDLSAWDG